MTVSQKHPVTLWRERERGGGRGRKRERVRERGRGREGEREKEHKKDISLLNCNKGSLYLSLELQ